MQQSGRVEAQPSGLHLERATGDVGHMHDRITHFFVGVLFPRREQRLGSQKARGTEDRQILINEPDVVIGYQECRHFWFKLPTVWTTDVEEFDDRDATSG